MHRREKWGAHGTIPHFYTFTIEIRFLPYKLSLYGPPDMSAFLRPCMIMYCQKVEPTLVSFKNSRLVKNKNETIAGKNLKGLNEF